MTNEATLPVSLGTMEETLPSQPPSNPSQQSSDSSQKSKDQKPPPVSFKKATKGEIFYDSFKDQVIYKLQYLFFSLN